MASQLYNRGVQRLVRRPLPLVGLALLLTMLVGSLPVQAAATLSPAGGAASAGRPAFAFAALPAGPQPVGLLPGTLPLTATARIVMPAVDVAALQAEDELRAAAGRPPRFAQPIPVTISPATAGTWEPLADGRLLWRLRIAAPGALSLNLGFTRYWMPAGGQLLLYTPDYRTIRGPFTAADNEAHGELWTPILPGDEIVVELALPATAWAELELTSVNHGYTGFGPRGGIESGACNLDVVCSAADGYPQVDAWRREIRSVAVISTGGSTFCTGFLVNNTAQDLKGYFMTARHCGITSGNAASLVAYWNYENSWCRPVDEPVNGQPGDGQLNQYNTGSYFRAAYAASDFTLVELDDPIDPAFNVHWAGWDRSADDALWAVGIHHPNTDEKRISFEDDPTTTTSYLGTSVPGDGTHIRVIDWDLGTTEPGSSGSPLFNQNHHVIGQLHGGYAACYNDESDWYGRFSVSWTGGGTPATRLSDWLDPIGSGVIVLPGRDRIEAPFGLLVAPAAADVCVPTDAAYQITVTQRTPGFVEPVLLAVAGEPPNTVITWSVNPVIPTGTSVLTIGHTDAAPAGSYDLDVTGSWSTRTLTVTVALNLYTGPAGPPTLLTPLDGAVEQPLQPSFSWSALPDAGSYSLEVDRSPLFPAPLFSISGLSAPGYTPGAPLDGGRCYWWRARGDNACGLGAWATPFHFATANLAVAFYDDIESGDGQWSHAAAQGADNWTISTAQSHSPIHAWFVPDDNVVTDSRLWNTLPVALGGGSTLTFWHRYQFEGSSYDGAVLEISVNGGSTWTDLGPYITAGGYNGVISTCCNNPLSGRQAWTGDLLAWTKVTVNLDAFAGQNAHFRWRLGCDWSIGDVGWYIDDVQITAPLPPAPAPGLASITPDNGTPYLEVPVEIIGSGLIATASVRLDSTWLLSVTQASSTTLHAVVPAGLAPGVYDLTLVNGDCQEAVLPAAFTVIDQCISPTVSFTSDSPVLVGEPMHFAAVVSGTSPFTYAWDFGGEGVGHGQGTAAPVYTYTHAGEYTVTLLVENFCGSAITTTLVLVEAVVCEEPQVEVSAGSPVELGRPMFFTATVVSGTAPFTYTWDMGGPGVGHGLDTATPVFTYTAAGDYTATVTVTNACGSAVAGVPVQVLVACEEPQVAVSAGSPVELGRPMFFTATVVSGTAPFTYSWDMGGPGVGHGLDTATPVFTYTAAGDYTATVTVTNACGSAVAGVGVAVLCSEPAVSFESDSPVVLGRPLHFTSTVTGTGPFTYTWDMGDGLGSSSLANPTYTYTAAGYFTVTLGVRGACGMAQFVGQVQVQPLLAYRIYLPLVLRSGQP